MRRETQKPEADRLTDKRAIAWPRLQRRAVVSLLGFASFIALPAAPETRLLPTAGEPFTISNLTHDDFPEDPVATWHQNAVTLQFGNSALEFQGDIKGAIASSFENWNQSGAPIPYLNFKEGGDFEPSLKADGINAIMVAPIDFPGHEDDLAITISFSNPKTLELMEADIVLNSQHEFSTELSKRYGTQPEADSCAGQYEAKSCGVAYDLENVLAHEIGHFLGLGENYDNPRSTMFSCTSACEEHKRDLDASDETAIRLAYENRIDQLGVPQCQFRPLAILQKGGNKQLPILSSLLVLFIIAYRRRNSLA